MTKFTLSKENILKLNSFISRGKEITSTSKYVFSPEGDKLTVAMMGNSFSVRFILAIENLVSDEDPDTLNYFVGDIISIANTALRVMGSTESVDIEIEKELEVTRTKISNPLTHTDIALTNYSQIPIMEAKEVLDTFDTDMKDLFKGDTFIVTPTIEFMNVMTTMCRSMVVSGREVNSAQISRESYEYFPKDENGVQSSTSETAYRTVIKYCDPQGIITYRLADDISPYDRDIIVQSAVIDYAKPFIKDGVTLTFEETDTWVKIDSQQAGFTMILGLEPNLFQFPSEQEESCVIPDPTSMTTISVDREALLSGLKTFDGVFRSELWRWSNIELDSSASRLSNNEIYFSHQDYNAEANTTVPVTIVENTDPATTDYTFLVGSAYLKDILDLMTDKTITIKYSSGEIGVPHGTGFIVESSNVRVVCIKILKKD